MSLLPYWEPRQRAGDDNMERNNPVPTDGHANAGIVFTPEWRASVARLKTYVDSLKAASNLTRLENAYFVDVLNPDTPSVRMEYIGTRPLGDFLPRVMK